ncbi:hypothetical protein BASA50_000400 [Batrachochytrium salamandrivorans]|uniref:3-hydroxyisobutyrate dehydrogenase n=1 Tax=Batrachochytrium salamandrivorans TaxID=1357716 RepID=A0ABQ8EWK5_9FUNG|nr:hypothetical protein BASA60_008595 [Batrachochytrium salamandrivorans]KAH6586445.1 hypothetical protein BASA50_000400 [Batrachochytrium salamandrivorans]KAH9275492.1 3-hydroxyisobutyrate dehydrogenase [Batrachochytrium salamandrivorans]
MRFTSLAAARLPSMARSFSSSPAAAKAKSIGFIGLGMMGFPMASNLLTKLNPESFTILDAMPATMTRFKAEHPLGSKVHIASTPQEVAEKSSVVITMLPTAAHVRNVFLGDNGLIKGVQKGALLMDSSTIDPKTVKDLAKALLEKNAIAMDTPVSGGTPGATNGTLTFMVGASTPEIFTQAKPILEGMGKNIVNCNGNGNGQIAKICNNMMLGISMIGVAETMNLGIRLGMDPKLLANILNTSTGRCWATDTYNPVPGVVPGVPSGNDYEGGFSLALITKDLGLASAVATESKTTIVMGGIAQQIYNQVLSTPGFEKKDFSQGCPLSGLLFNLFINDILDGVAPINAICSGTDNDVFTLNVQGQLVRSQHWFWSRRTKQLYRNRYWLTPQDRPKTVKQRHSFALMETLRTCGDSASLQKYVTRQFLDTFGFFKDPSFDQSRAHGTRYLMLARMDALWTARKAIQIGILVDTHPFSADHCILCDQQLLSTSIAHLVVECEQVTGHRIQSGLVPAIQKSRLRLLGRALDPGVENVYTWLRGGVLNGEADLDQRWLDGTVEHESMGTRHDNRVMAARLADSLQVAYRQYQSTLWKIPPGSTCGSWLN